MLHEFLRLFIAALSEHGACEERGGGREKGVFSHLLQRVVSGAQASLGGGGIPGEQLYHGFVV